MKFLSLFSGIGAPESAFKRIGYDIDLVNYCEIDKYASKSYSTIHNVPESLNLWDVTKINPYELPDFDMVFHGSPCQSFSVAGKGDGGQKDSGTRSSLMWYMVEIVKVKQPKVVMWENVKGVLSKKHRETFDEYLNEMAHLGYNNYWKLLNTKDYGVPQNRERVFVISIRKDVDTFADRLDGFPWKEKFDNGLRLKDFLEQNVDERYYLKSNKITKLQNSKFNQEKSRIQNAEVCDTLLARDYKDQKCVSVKEYSNISVQKDNLLVEPSGIYTGVSDAFQRGPLKGVSRCLKAMIHDAGVTDGFRIRKLTPKECWRLQGFTDEEFETAAEHVSNTQLYKQAGNSITVDVLVYIFKELVKMFETTEISTESIS